MITTGVSITLTALIPISHIARPVISIDWEIASDPLFNNIVISNSNDTSGTFKYNTVAINSGPYYGRYLLETPIGNTGYSNIDSCAVVGVNPPILDIVIANNGDYIITGSPYDIIDAAGEHINTSWMLVDSDGTIVFSSTDDTTNLYSITIPKATFKNNRSYTIMASYNGAYIQGTYGFNFFNTYK